MLMNINILNYKTTFGVVIITTCMSFLLNDLHLFVLLGPSGSAGIPGLPGAAGAQGARGERGDRGEPGLSGAQG